MKRIIFCFDGTWNKLHAANLTNVALVAESIFPTAADGAAQIIHYDDGVGTGGGDWKFSQAFERFTGGILGWGMLDNIREAYRFLIFNYEPGDEIYVFGFSRGAYTARSFIGLLRCASVIARSDASQINNAVEFYRNRLTEDPSHRVRLWQFRARYAPHVIVTDDEEEWRTANVPGHVAGTLPRLTIRYAGLWDTVGALGIPASLPGAAKVNRRHQFHDAELPKFLESGRHAAALDERRRSFPVTTWESVEERNREKGHDWAAPDAPIQEQWFPGTHGSVGGGGEIRGLSDAALGWIIDGARKQGLHLDTSASSRVYEVRPDHRAPLVNMKAGLDFMSKHFPKKERAGPMALHQVHVSARRRWFESAENLPERTLYRPKSLDRVAAALNAEMAQCPPPYAGPVAAHHRVARGETLRRIARTYYGDADAALLIFEANRNLLDDPNHLHVGDELVIPQRPPVPDCPPS